MQTSLFKKDWIKVNSSNQGGGSTFGICVGWRALTRREMRKHEQPFWQYGLPKSHLGNLIAVPGELFNDSSRNTVKILVRISSVSNLQLYTMNSWKTEKTKLKLRSIHGHQNRLEKGNPVLDMQVLECQILSNRVWMTTCQEHFELI